VAIAAPRSIATGGTVVNAISSWQGVDTAGGRGWIVIARLSLPFRVLFRRVRTAVLCTISSSFSSFVYFRIITTTLPCLCYSTRRQKNLPRGLPRKSPRLGRGAPGRTLGCQNKLSISLSISDLLPYYHLSIAASGGHQGLLAGLGLGQRKVLTFPTIRRPFRALVAGKIYLVAAARCIYRAV
jgi:hypothetical protein